MRTLSDIYDEAFLRKYLTATNRLIFSPKSFHHISLEGFWVRFLLIMFPWTGRKPVEEEFHVKALSPLFHQKSTKKVRKIFSILPNKLFSFSRYSNSCIFLWLKINPKIYDVIMCLNKNLETNCLNIWKSKEGLILELGRLINKKERYAKNIYQKLVSNFYLKVVSALFLLVCFLGLKESTCETRKNVFYFTSNALFVLEIIRF